MKAVPYFGLKSRLGFYSTYFGEHTQKVASQVSRKATCTVHRPVIWWPDIFFMATFLALMYVNSVYIMCICFKSMITQNLFDYQFDLL
jgi:hypothetical protein